VKYLPLIWSGIWRQRARAVLMLLQMISAFTLFGVLQGVSSGTKQAIAATHPDRLYVTSSVSTSDLLPIALLERIRAIPGVRAVTPRTVLVGTYVNPDQRLPIIAADPGPFFRAYDELTVSPSTAVKALASAPTGAIIGGELAKRHGWKIGDRIVFQSPVARHDGSHAWTFDVVGTYAAPDQLFGTPPPTAIVANFSYVNEARANDADRVLGFVLTVHDVNEAGAVGLAIDNTFANSDHETRTQSEGDLVSTNIQKTVDLDFIVRSIVAAVFFALLLSISALMMRSLRERTPELAVLKTVGFSDDRVLMLILSESIAFCLCASVIGLAVGAALLTQARPLVGITRMPPIVVAAGLGCALILALVSGAVPAVRGSRLQVADALAGR
jgi:putative ABC transport system permease protein